jgi:iron complex outermembrane receptor protein
MTRTVTGAIVALVCTSMVQARELGRVATEDDYFGNVPVVLTASRLDQPLNEAPGAITVIDRSTIRLSGARTVAEVLRLVPGYLSGGRNGANPGGAYHIPLDDYGTRNLVLIDGRSVYSSVYLGDTSRGMLDVMLEDIERIEVLRGANSAAYGANAMFGVINIITRHSADTTGAEVSVTTGNTGVRDKRVRVGGGDDKASFRISAGEQRDTGYLNAYDDKRLSQLHGRADFKPNFTDDLMVSAGLTYLSAGEGFPTANGNPLHTIDTRDSYANVVWRRQLSSTDELQVSANYMEDWKRDLAGYIDTPAALMDYGGIGQRGNFELQRKMGLTPELRAVLGLGYKYERAKSEGLYARSDWISYQEERLFGTLEWRASPQWLFNAGLFIGQQSMTGTYTAPRLMANWLVSPEHTFRAGVTDSVRPPTLFELQANVRQYLNGALYNQEVLATGSAQPEKLRSKEIGYLGRFADLRLTLDVRAYQEHMDTAIWGRDFGGEFDDYQNVPGVDIKGIEYQMRWKPLDTTEFWLNQNYAHYAWRYPIFANRLERKPPDYATTIAWFQQLPCQWRLSASYQMLGNMTWRDSRDLRPAAHRTDVRLARALRIGDAKAEIAFVMQSAEGDQPFFLPSAGFESPRRTFVNLTMEF